MEPVLSQTGANLPADELCFSVWVAAWHGKIGKTMTL